MPKADLVIRQRARLVLRKDSDLDPDPSEVNKQIGLEEKKKLDDGAKERARYKDDATNDLGRATAS